MTRPYNKPALTYDEQVRQLQARGLQIDDAAAAARSLQHLNYYRLGAYWLPFEADHTTHSFRPGTHLNHVLALYEFDRSLRLLVLDAIERIEVSVRAQWAYQLGHAHGPHAHLVSTLAQSGLHWQQNIDALTAEIQRSDEVFIRHLLATYSEPTPPVWAVCEVMSLGLLSRWYHNLKPMPTREAIARVYGLQHFLLQSWLHHLTHVRNVCAHHSRLWNREFTITPTQPRNRPAELVQAFQPGSRRLYNTLLILLHCMRTLAPRNNWRTRLTTLLGTPGVELAAMGFPAGWERQPMWMGGQP